MIRLLGRVRRSRRHCAAYLLALEELTKAMDETCKAVTANTKLLKDFGGSLATSYRHDDLADFGIGR